MLSPLPCPTQNCPKLVAAGCYPVQDEFRVRRLLPYVNRYRRAFLVGLLCVLATTAFQLLSPWVLKYAIDDLESGVTREKLLLYAGLLVAVSLMRGLFLFLMRRIIIGASRDIEYDIRNDFFARLEQLPLGYYH